MAKKHKHRKVHTKVIGNIHVLGGWGGHLFDDYDGYDEYGEYVDTLQGLGKAQKKSKKEKATLKATKIEVVTPKFEVCPAKSLPEKQV